MSLNSYLPATAVTMSQHHPFPALMRLLDARPLTPATLRKNVMKFEIWVIVHLIGQHPLEAELLGPHRAESVRKAFAAMFQRPPLRGRSAICLVTSLIPYQHLIDCCWLWSLWLEHDLSVKVKFMCVRLHLRSCLSGVPHGMCGVCVCVCACLWLRLWLQLLWSLSNRPEGTDNIQSSIIPPSVCPSSLSFYATQPPLPPWWFNGNMLKRRQHMKKASYVATHLSYQVSIKCESLQYIFFASPSLWDFISE